MQIEPSPDGPNWTAIVVVFQGIQWLLNIALAVWVYFRDSEKKNASALVSLQSDLAEQQNRLQALEDKFEDVPTKADVARLIGELGSVRVRVEGVVDLVERIEHQTNLIHQHLLTNRK